MKDNEMSRETMRAYVMVALDQLEKARDFAYEITNNKEEVRDIDVYEIIRFITEARMMLKATI